MMKNWILAIRPKTLTAAVAPVVIGTAMAFDENRHQWGYAALCLLGALLIQVATNLANDYYDGIRGTDTKDRKGPVRATQAGLIKPENIKKAFIIIFLLSAVVGGLLAVRGGWPMVWIMALSIVSGYFYTGGPKPLGYMGLGDLFVLVFFGPVAVGGTYYVQTMDINGPVILAGLAPGFLSVAILAVNNLRDIEEDAKAKKNTLAVRFGDMFARWEYFFCVMAAVLIPLVLMFWTQDHLYLFMPVIGLMILSRTCIRNVTLHSDGKTLNAVLAKTGQLLFIYSVLFSLGWVL